MNPKDPAHDFAHLSRVAYTAKKLCQEEHANPWIVVPAAWFHDLINLPKNDPQRALASQKSAEKAEQILVDAHYPNLYIQDVAHAIAAHSYSANIEPRSLEAKIVQDADRLDALGAIGIARCFAIAGIMKRPFYNIQDPFCCNRAPEDNIYTIDHFYQKLFQIEKTLKTDSAKKEGARRVLKMKLFLQDLSDEILSPNLMITSNLEESATHKELRN